jgi:putative endonuclease
MFTVYVLRSKRNGRRYIGCTNDFDRRLEEHLRGQSTYTRNTGPYELVYKEEFLTLKEARKRESFLKSGKGREFLKSIGK